MGSGARQSEADRLEQLAGFERLQFIPWLEAQAAAAILTPEDILACLHYAFFDGLVFDLVYTDTTARFKRLITVKGLVPVEIAIAFFLHYQWPADKPIPSRAVNWNQKYLEKHGELFVSTHTYLKTFGI